MQYVVGFMFTPGRRWVTLIQKNHPEWQRGLLDGVGGKIEPGETALQAVVREFEEETGVRQEEWHHAVHLVGAALPDRAAYSVDFFYCESDQAVNTRSVTDELVMQVDASALHRQQVVGDLRWLIPLVLDPHMRASFPLTLEDRSGN
jgi:8-oxo-dGTP diphosphatase